MVMVGELEKIITTVTNIMRIGGPLIGFLIIILESIIPILPLGVLIALNNIVFGSFWGFVISWIATIMGCFISYYVFRLGLSKILYRNLKLDGKAYKFMHYVTKMSLAKLTLLVALPFTPAFLVNIAAGLSKMKTRKYFMSILIGKLSVVYFWGYIGAGFIESIRNPFILLEISVLMGIAYIISRLIQKYININEVK
jgi:uncharacterized membrane protein YdjX (TVP38/TMEM64 family)